MAKLVQPKWYRTRDIHVPLSQNHMCHIPVPIFRHFPKVPPMFWAVDMNLFFCLLGDKRLQQEASRPDSSATYILASAWKSTQKYHKRQRSDI